MVIGAGRITDDLVGRVPGLPRQFECQRTRAGRLSIYVLGERGRAGAEKRDAVPLTQIRGDPIERKFIETFGHHAPPRTRDSASIVSCRSWSGRLVSPKAPSGTPASGLGRPT